MGVKELHEARGYRLATPLRNEAPVDVPPATTSLVDAAASLPAGGWVGLATVHNSTTEACSTTEGT